MVTHLIKEFPSVDAAFISMVITAHCSEPPESDLHAHSSLKIHF
jgi:hypothetical protein